MYQSRMFPPMNGGKAHRVLSKPSCTLTSSTSADCNRVSVNTVPKRAIPGPNNRVTLPQAPSSSLTPQQSYDNNSQTTSPGFALVPTVVVSDATTATQKQSNTPPKKLPTASPSTSTDARPMKPAPPLRKDPMASLFVPKHRAYSQRPVQRLCSPFIIPLASRLVLPNPYVQYHSAYCMYYQFLHSRHCIVVPSLAMLPFWLFVYPSICYNQTADSGSSSSTVSVQRL